MSLRVWLPLKGDLTNNGAYNVAVTNTNATVDTNGKIGSCYRFNKNAYITIAKEAVSTIDSGECSFCLWLNINSFNAAWDTYVQFGLGTTPWVAYTMGLLRNSSSSNLVFVISNGSTSSQNSYTTPNVTLGQWFHIACVYKPGHCLIYINGTLYADNATSLVPNFSAVTAISLGGLPSTYKTDSSINDFRIYDHALSAKEVKEISKGLILHMPLDNNGAGMPNLLTDSADLTQWSKTSNTTVNWDEGNKLYKITYTGTDTTRYGVYQDLTIEANTTYTVSCTLEGPSCGIAFGFYDSSVSWPTTIISVTGNKVRKSYTLTSGANSTKARVFLLTNASTAKEAWFNLPKLEKSSIVTPWCPNTSDALYSSLGFDSSTVYDISGYGNNGTLSSSKPSVDPDSQRYSASMLFNGSNNYIVCGRGSMVRDAITINMWAYMDSWSGYTRMASCTEGGGWNFEPGSGKMNFAMGTGVSSNTYKSVLSTQTLASLSGWVMFTGTYDGFSTKIYINGVLSNTNTAYTTKTPIFYNASNGLFIGAEAGGNAVTPAGYYFKGKISDFRIYATALSDDDIMELYTAPVSIDNGGTIHAYGFTENGAANEVSKLGIVNTGIDRAHYLIPNFSETGNLTGWTVGSGGVLTNGVIVLTGTNISVRSTAFPVGANDIICVEFTVSVPTPSTTTSGPGIYIGTQSGQTGRAIAFNFTSKKYNEGTSTGTNNYFLSSYNSTATNNIKTFIIGSDVDINTVPFAERSVTTHGVNIMRILSGDTTYIRTGYNSNTSMVINISNFKIYKINQHGICENAGEKSIGKGYLSFANYNEI